MRDFSPWNPESQTEFVPAFDRCGSSFGFSRGELCPASSRKERSNIRNAKRRKLRLSLSYAEIFPNQDFNICSRDSGILPEVSADGSVVVLEITKPEQTLLDSLDYSRFKNLGSNGSSLTWGLQHRIKYLDYSHVFWTSEVSLSDDERRDLL